MSDGAPQQRPLPLGISTGPDQIVGEPTIWQDYGLPEGQRLGSLLLDYDLLTTAILDCYGPQPVDLVGEFFLQLGDAAWRPQRLTAPRVLFLGLPEPYCRQLVLVPRPLTAALRQHLLTAALFDGQHLYRVRATQIFCPELTLQPQQVPVTGYCWDATTGCVYFRQQRTPAGETLAAAFHNPELIFENTRQMAAAYRRGSSTPYQDSEEPRA